MHLVLVDLTVNPPPCAAQQRAENCSGMPGSGHHWLTSLVCRTPGVSRRRKRERGSWVGARRVALPYVSSHPPFRTARTTFMVYGSAPTVLLQGYHPEAFLRLSPASTEYTVHSLRVRWVPLLQSFRRLGAFAMGTPPRVHGFPGLRLLCPIRLSSGASTFREAFPPHSFPTALHIPSGVSRVPPGRLKQNEGGGVLSLPLPLFAAPQSLALGYGRLTKGTVASTMGCLGPYSHRSCMISGSTG
jgi:hypothetical protein